MTTFVSGSSGPPPDGAGRQLIYGDADTTIMRLGETPTGERLLLKRVSATAPRHLHERLRHEYETLQGARCPCFLTPLSLSPRDGALELLCVDVPGEPLLNLVRSPELPPMPLDQFFPVAAALVRALGQAHGQSLVHHALRPATILFDAASERCCFLDLGLMVRRAQRVRTGERLEDEYDYLAPEATGLVNRATDERADMYAVGVILYQLLTGRHPVASPCDPRRWTPELPECLVTVVMKLLARLPEDRYQSTIGLHIDLRACADGLKSAITPVLTLSGMMASPDSIHVSAHLYGRARETTQLLRLFAAVANTGRPQVVVVSGYSGIGKSSLVAELQAPAIARGGHFVVGKFDQYRRNIPYSAIVQAYTGFLQKLLAMDEGRLDAWRRRIQAAVRENGQLLVGLLPQAQLILGPQPPLAEVPPEQAARRLQQLMRRFTATLASAEHPLVLFLGDLHWADAASLEWLANLQGGVESELRYLLIVVAYRSNESGSAGALLPMFERLPPRGLEVTRIDLEPLSEADIGSMLADMVQTDDADEVRALAGRVCAKTGGNPFFSSQFITSLAQDGLFYIDRQTHRWRWNLEEIDSRTFTDNVLDLMLEKLRRLPASTQRALAIGGLMSSRFETGLLARVMGCDLGTTLDVLHPAHAAGMIARQGGFHNFLHDRVQEAAHSLLEPIERAQLHACIGRTMLAWYGDAGAEVEMFQIVEHLNAGAAAMAGEGEHRLVAQLNARAATKARGAALFDSAADYLTIAVDLLPADRAATDDELQFRLRLARADCWVLAGKMRAAEAELDSLEALSHSLVDRCQISFLRIRVLMTRGQYRCARAVALSRLVDLGVRVPERPTPPDVDLVYAEVDLLMADRSIESLLDLPRCEDPVRRTAIQMMAAVTTATYFDEPLVWALHVPRMLVMALNAGTTEASVMVYTFFGFELAGGRRRYAEGYRYCLMAHELMQRLEVSSERGNLLAHMAFTAAWVRPLDEVLPVLDRAIEACLENGDTLMASTAAHHVVLDMLIRGVPLSQLTRPLERALELASLSQYELIEWCVRPRRDLVQVLRRESSVRDELADPDPELVARFQNSKPSMATFCYWSTYLMGCYLRGDVVGARAAAARAEALLHSVSGTLEEFLFVLFDSLSLAATGDTVLPAPTGTEIRSLQAHVGQLQEWAAINPATFIGAAFLVRAELERMRHQPGIAMDYYEKAIAHSRGSGQLWLEAVAHERAAHFYERHGAEQVASMYFRESWAAFGRWGAIQKQSQLASTRPDVAFALPTQEVPAGVLDLQALANASRAISSRRSRVDLLRELLDVVLQYAGAELAQLYMSSGGQLRAAATARGLSPDVVVELHGADSEVTAPLSLLNYVRHTHEEVIVDDASITHRYDPDPVFSTRNPRSILCLPILRQGIMLGVLYLEHGRMTHLFNPGRLLVLRQLMAQAAISLESADLYEQLEDGRRALEQKVEARTAEVQRSRLALQTMLDSSDAMISLKGLDHRYLMHNRRFAAGFGRSAENLVGLRVEDIGDTELVDRVNLQDREVLAFDHAIRFEEEIRFAGLVRAVQVEKFPVRDASGMTYAIGSVAVDVTDLRSARQAAEDAARAKTEFLANMSHEIRTPLNAVIGLSQLVLRGSLNAQQRDYMQKVDTAAQSVLRLVNDVLDISKLEAGLFELERAPFEIRRALEQVVDVVGVRAAQKGIVVRLAVSPDVPPAFLGDSLRLGQVLVNLCNNAVKFTEHGEVVVELLLTSMESKTAMLEFAVADTGIGMDSEARAKLFRPFSQADASISRRFGGTGLGLAISRRLVQQMGGVIHAQSELGVGSRFSFRVPLQVIQNPTGTSLPDAAPVPAAGGARPRLDGIRVLVVDDHEINRELAHELLAEEGARVFHAEDGVDALERLGEQDVDVVLMDCRMPRVDGFEATRAIRATGRWPGLPIIAMTANAMREDKERAFAAGMNDYIVKPIVVADMLVTIERHLRAR